jgi:large subunit ribosomal protein L4
MTPMEVSVIDLANKTVGKIELVDSIFAAPVRTDLIARTIDWQLAKRRAGTHKVKAVGEVRGTTRKPYRQKGTGRARQGSLRSPQFRGGAVTFGPVVRAHGYKLPKKVRRYAMRAALSSKQAEGKLIVLDSTKLKTPRTKDLARRLQALGWASALILDGPEVDANFQRAVANIPGIDLLPQQGVNVYDIIRRETLVLTRDAIKHLEERLA